ncbi:tyrosine-type recombinase/integrase [Streptomyces sannanensis]|uniref:Tyrosine-type recombinase/integrase n=1 Tax=Streptomyces sannanensis TaxID=285536 RepID=A0ABP6SMH1_9ACTN
MSADGGMAAVVPFPGDPQVAALLSVVSSCLRKNASRGLCAEHDLAWRKAGRPDREAWIADPANWPAGLSLDVASCRVGGCPYSGGLSRLCDLHLADWNGLHSRGRRIGVIEYAAAAPVLDRPAVGPCSFPACGYGVSRHQLCDGHHYRWAKIGRPPLAEFPAELERRNIPRFSVAGLPPLAALEFQYLLQIRTDQRRSKVIPSAWVRAVNTVIAEGVTSVRDRTAQHWGQLSPHHTTVRQLFTDMLEALGDLDGPAEEWDRDVWRPDRLGFSVEERQRVAPLDFTGITQPWLRETVKRYLRLRLARTELRTAARNLNDFVQFSRFIAEARPDRQHDPAVLDRPLLESYIGWVGRRTVEKKGAYCGRPLTPSSRSRLLSVVATLLETWRRYHWQPVLPPDARIHQDEYPRPRGLKANFIDEHLMEQIESEENLALLDPETRALVLICRDEGLRISEALILKTDCLKKTPSGRWALVHYKSKDKSFRAIPASRAVVDAIREQHGRVRERFGDACRWLFPKVSGNPDGKYPMPYGTADTRFDAWLQRIRLIDSNGDPAIVNWHQFRHTLGARMANAGVSGRTVREILGHTSWEMQEHYSRIADETLRREYEEKYEVRFNLKGEAVKVRADADLSGVEWLAEKIGRRLHAVAGGWCGRHISRPCPKTAADGCYFCQDFQSDRQFLPVHRDTLARTRELQADATAAGRSRTAEVNERLAAAVEHAITRITDQEYDELSPNDAGASRDATERTADAG